MLKAIKKGFTLIEVAIAMAIVAVLTGAVAAVVSTNAANAGDDVTEVNADVNASQGTADTVIDSISLLN